MGEKVMEEKALSCYGLLLTLIKSGKKLVFSHLLHYYLRTKKVKIQFLSLHGRCHDAIFTDCSSLYNYDCVFLTYFMKGSSLHAETFFAYSYIY
jgi:hypothetical protein